MATPSLLDMAMSWSPPTTMHLTTMLEQAKDMFVDLPHKIIKYIFYD